MTKIILGGVFGALRLGGRFSLREGGLRQARFGKVYKEGGRGLLWLPEKKIASQGKKGLEFRQLRGQYMRRS